MLKVLHVLEHSLPKLAGYTIRSKYIIDNQRREGIEPIVITSPLQGKRTRPLRDFDEIDSVRYYRTGEFNRLEMSAPLPARLLRRYSYSRAYGKAIRWAAREENVRIIHAHSSYLNGVRANQAARMLGLPSVYEVRGLWQDTATVNAEINTGHWKYRFIDYMERRAMLGSDRVVTISNKLKDDLIRKGVPEGRLVVVPNGVDTEIFRPREKERKIVHEFGLDKKIVFGFIGSVRKIEGLALLLENLGKILDVTKEIKVLIVGDGDEIPRLREITEKNGTRDYVAFAGRVSHDEILDYYSVMDILVYPRIDARVNHKVTPLKPLEAMAMEKAVVASDVGGLRELVAEGENGLLFRCDDGDHLVRRCLELVEKTSLRKELASRARTWTVRERDWSKIIKLYNDVYADVQR